MTISCFFNAILVTYWFWGTIPTIGTNKSCFPPKNIAVHVTVRDRKPMRQNFLQEFLGKVNNKKLLWSTLSGLDARHLQKLERQPVRPNWKHSYLNLGSRLSRVQNGRSKGMKKTALWTKNCAKTSDLESKRTVIRIMWYDHYWRPWVQVDGHLSQHLTFLVAHIMFKRPSSFRPLQRALSETVHFGLDPSIKNIIFIFLST